MCIRDSFYGHTLNINGLLNLHRSDTHIHNVDAKRCRVDNDSATYFTTGISYFAVRFFALCRLLADGKEGGR